MRLYSDDIYPDPSVSPRAGTIVAVAVMVACLLLAGCSTVTKVTGKASAHMSKLADEQRRLYACRQYMESGLSKLVLRQTDHPDSIRAVSAVRSYWDKLCWEPIDTDVAD